MELNLSNIISKIKKYDAQLLPVVKNKNNQEIKFLYEFGLRDFGENKLKDFNIHSKEYHDVNYHFIAPIQTNKISKLTNFFSTVHTLSRKKEIEYFSKFDNENLSYYIQLNIDEDPQKNGVFENQVNEFYEFGLEHNLNIVGLMTIPNIKSDPKYIYKKMYEINEGISSRNRFYKKQLSMGMSDDYEIALDYGATIVRIGNLLFKKW